MYKYVLIVVIVVVLGAGFIVVRNSKTNNTKAIPITSPNTVVSSVTSKVDHPTPKPASSSSSQSLDQQFSDVQSGLNKLDSDQKNAQQDTSSQDNPPAQ